MYDNTPQSKKPRPIGMQGVTERIRTGHGNTYITINFDETGHPFEVFTTLGKAGSCGAANLEAISRLATLALRSGIPAAEVIDQLQGINCHPVWDQGELVRSAPDAVAIALKRHEKGAVPVVPEHMQLPLFLNPKPQESAPIAIGFVCPECKSPVSFREGMVVCTSCAWNRSGG